MTDTNGVKQGTVMPPNEQKHQLRAHAAITPIVPQTIEEAFRLAQWVCGAGLAPNSYEDANHKPDPQKVVIGILKAMEVGAPPITGLSFIAIINKRACVWGDLAIGLAQEQGMIEKMEEFFEGAQEKVSAPVEQSDGERDHTPLPTDFPDDFTAVCRIWRKGQETPYEGRFSVRDAKRAHLWGNPKKITWMEHPKRMLKARARAFALRDGFADALHALSIREEVEDLPPEAPAKTDIAFLEDKPRALEAPTQTPLPITKPAAGSVLPAAVTAGAGAGSSAQLSAGGPPSPPQPAPAAVPEPPWEKAGLTRAEWQKMKQ